MGRLSLECAGRPRRRVGATRTLLQIFPAGRTGFSGLAGLVNLLEVQCRVAAW